MRMLLATACLVAAFGQAMAADDTPVDVRHAWRARLATMAPACGKKPASWSDKTMIAVTADTLATLPRGYTQDQEDLVAGELAMARRVGKNLAKLNKGSFCPLLVSDLALENTDQMIADTEKAGITTLPEPGKTVVPDAIMAAAAMAIEPAVDVACGFHDDDWGVSRLGDVISEVGEAEDPKQTKAMQNRNAQQGTGAALLADYVGERLVAVDHDDICASARQPSNQKTVARLLKDHDRLMKKMLKGLATPDD